MLGRAHYEIADSTTNVEMFEQAVQDFTDTLQFDEDSPTTFRWRAKALMSLERYSDALADFDRAIQLRPDDADLYEERSDTRYMLFEQSDSAAKLDAAIEDSSEALRLAPGLFRALQGRCYLHFLAKNYEASLADYEQVLEVLPDDLVCMHYRCLCLIWLGRYRDLLDASDELIARSPSDASAYFYRGASFRDLGYMEEALADYDEALRLDPTESSCYCKRGDLWRDHGEFECALSDYDAAIANEPDDSEAFDRRGQVWLRLGEPEKARADFDTAIRLQPNKTAFYRSRLGLWEMLGQDAEADADAARILELEEPEGSITCMPADKVLIEPLLREHFGDATPDRFAITERFFPTRVHADLQRALDDCFSAPPGVRHFHPVQRGCGRVGDFTSLLVKDRLNPLVAAPPQYHEIDIGEDNPVRCLLGGVWLVEDERCRYAVVLDSETQRGIRFQVASMRDSAVEVASSFFQHLEDAVRRSVCYRGKILSLEFEEQFSGQSHGIRVHKLRQVCRGDVILPQQTLQLLDRNVIQFIARRPRLVELGVSARKGLLFHGPPGTGKTHTLHYLAAALPDQTTFIITAEEVGRLGEYLTLARLLQPSIVVIEDVDLIARDRNTVRNTGEEVMLNRLLNEMDGLREEAEILFVLTTNHPEALEGALAARPGRIDQAIEFPLPDEDGRARLVRLYAPRVDLRPEVVEAVVKRTANVSASFIKELMRRALQFHLERTEDGGIDVEDVELALGEMIHQGGILNRKLLGAGRLGFG